MVPSDLPRCPNHPDRVAVSFCNDCRQSYCDGCLSNYAVEGRSGGGYLYLCPGCLQSRYLDAADRYIVVGVVSLIIGFLIFLVQPFMGAFMIVILGLPMLAYGFYKRRLYVKDTSARVEGEKTTVEEKSQPMSQDIYLGMLIEYTRMFGTVHASIMLENEVRSYMETGLTREEAIRKLAEDRGYS